MNKSSPAKPPDQDISSLNPYEQTVRVVTVFFSAVTGLGLKELLNPKNFEQHQTLQALCFVCALLLLLRFLFGSANHLWAEANARVEKHKCELRDPELVLNYPAAKLFAWHLFCLIIYFLSIMWICYAEEVPDFLFRISVFAGLASFLALVTPDVEGESYFDLTGFWFSTNALQAVTALALSISPTAPFFSDRVKLWILAVQFLIILLWDVCRQIIGLEDFCRDLKAETSSTINGGTARSNQSIPSPRRYR